MSSGISSPLRKKKEKSVSSFWAARVKAASTVFFLIIEMPQKLYFISLSAFVTSMSSFSKFTKRAELKTSSRLWSVDSRRRTGQKGEECEEMQWGRGGAVETDRLTQEQLGGPTWLWVRTRWVRLFRHQRALFGCSHLSCLLGTGRKHQNMCVSQTF